MFHQLKVKCHMNRRGTFVIPHSITAGIMQAKDRHLGYFLHEKKTIMTHAKEEHLG
jgi:hypothetical protein